MSRTPAQPPKNLQDPSFMRWVYQLWDYVTDLDTLPNSLISPADVTVEDGDNYIVIGSLEIASGINFTIASGGKVAIL